jgi:hypothetical protein
MPNANRIPRNAAIIVLARRITTSTWATEIHRQATPVVHRLREEIRENPRSGIKRSPATLFVQ